MLKILLSAFLFTLILQLSLFADVSQAKALETQIWQNIKDHKWEDLDKQIAPYFQLTLRDGVRTKEQFKLFAKELNLSDFTLSNFTITEGPGLIVMSYDVVVAETISAKRIISKAIRQSVWQQNNETWQWVAHSIFIPMAS